MTFYDSDDTGTGTTVACFLTDVPRRSLAPVACLRRVWRDCAERWPRQVRRSMMQALLLPNFTLFQTTVCAVTQGQVRGPEDFPDYTQEA